MRDPKSILVTGGSSGIGEALLLLYASPGVTLAFNGRDKERIGQVAEKLGSMGATVHSRAVDVTDKDGMARWIREVDDVAPLELVIANAGIGTPEGTDLSIDDKMKLVFDVNVNGVFNTVHPALERMLERGRGQIAIVSSLSGYMGLGHTPEYSASKAAVKAYGRALRTRYMREGVEISVITPGVIPSRMTESFYRTVAGWVPMDRAVRIIRRGLERNRGLLTFPWYYSLPLWWMTTLPDSWIDVIHSRLLDRMMRSRSKE